MWEWVFLAAASSTHVLVRGIGVSTIFPIFLRIHIRPIRVGSRNGIALRILERPLNTWVQVSGSYMLYLRGVSLMGNQGFQGEATRRGDIFVS